MERAPGIPRRWNMWTLCSLKALKSPHAFSPLGTESCLIFIQSEGTSAQCPAPLPNTHTLCARLLIHPHAQPDYMWKINSLLIKHVVQCDKPLRLTRCNDTSVLTTWYSQVTNLLLSLMTSAVRSPSARHRPSVLTPCQSPYKLNCTDHFLSIRNPQSWRLFYQDVTAFIQRCHPVFPCS